LTEKIKKRRGQGIFFPMMGGGENREKGEVDLSSQGDLSNRRVEGGRKTLSKACSREGDPVRMPKNKKIGVTDVLVDIFTTGGKEKKKRKCLNRVHIWVN